MKTNDKNIMITDIQRFCMHDGPGIRTTVFLKAVRSIALGAIIPKQKIPTLK